MALLFDSLLVNATVALISLITLLYFYFEHKFTYWKKRGVTLPEASPYYRKLQRCFATVEIPLALP
uniref:Uncharacterized protein n=1 Tax=Timema genevievae TaxID=629358 RepID=A0A7R9PS83_TIMGE|nr:unnamed protein product [Timema genevievae]